MLTEHLLHRPGKPSIRIASPLSPTIQVPVAQRTFLSLLLAPSGYPFLRPPPSIRISALPRIDSLLSQSRLLVPDERELGDARALRDPEHPYVPLVTRTLTLHGKAALPRDIRDK